MNSTVWSVIGIIVVVGALFVGAQLMAPPAPEKVTGDAATLLAIAPDDHVKVATSSTVTLVEYLDFECPACGAYYPIMKQVQAEFGDRVTFVTRHFPLSGHKNGLSSALAVEAAGKQGKFWEMHDLLYESQKEWGGKQAPTPQIFEPYAAKLGLDMEQFKADVASKEVLEHVQHDVAVGRALGVNSTPSFFLNGTKLQNPASVEAFRALIQAELDKQTP